MTSPAPHRRRSLRILAAELADAFGMALGAVASHKLRSALTLLGVLVGVFSIIVVMTAIRVLQSNIESELGGLGANVFQIQRWPVISVEGPEGWEKVRRRKRIDYPLAQQLRERATLARQIAVEATFANGEAASRFEKTNPNVQYLGVSPEIFAARNWNVAEGRALLAGDLDSARAVCVLGANLAAKLFPRGSAVGEEVKFDNLAYTVVGVLESRGGALDGNQENFLAVPVTVALNRYGRQREVMILVQAESAERFDDTIEHVRGILRTVRRVPPGQPDDFELFSNDSLIEQFRTLTAAVRTGAGVISSIALLAAGIGIMNIMLVSVTERTREIGIRRAVGAKKRTILTQFIFEAVVLCQVGGILGVVLGVAGGNAAAIFFKVPPVVPVDWVIFGLLICSAVGVVFGTYPAWKAANLDPIESLRYE
ncbi:MAG: ABC transporter permease [Verrucomicrobia bacterium]|nr:ABC transporter permease [Verrucomicrobiota bacterium]